jgi:hypothetical protein
MLGVRDLTTQDNSYSEALTTPGVLHLAQAPREASRCAVVVGETA